MFREKIENFFWKDVESEHLEKVKEFEDPDDYNKGMELLVKMKEEERHERESNKMDAQTKLGIASLVLQGLSIASAVFLGIFAYCGDSSMNMSNGKVWNISSRLLNKDKKI